jgi:NAD(P)H-quinone oxidoreductase subunit 3
VGELSALGDAVILDTRVVMAALAGSAESDAWLLSHRRRTVQKGLPYESGIDTIGDTWSRFGLAFYLFALLFVAFDVEIIFVYLWAVVIRAVSVPGIVMMGIFLVVLMFGEFYAWRKGDLRWH